jgi:hypothetical protein
MGIEKIGTKNEGNNHEMGALREGKVMVRNRSDKSNKIKTYLCQQVDVF